MKNQKGEPRKGDKKRYIRAAIKRLGLDASYGPALAASGTLAPASA